MNWNVFQLIGSNYEEKPVGSILRAAQCKPYSSEDGANRFLWNTFTKLQEFTSKDQNLKNTQNHTLFSLSNNWSAHYSRTHTGSNAQSAERSTTYWGLSNIVTIYIIAVCPHIQPSVVNGTTQEKITQRKCSWRDNAKKCKMWSLANSVSTYNTRIL